MAFTLPDFLNAPLVESAFKNMAQNYKAGAEARATPERLRQEQRQRELANALAGINLPYADQMARTNLEGKKIDNILSQRKVDYPGMYSNNETLQFMDAMRMLNDRPRMAAPMAEQGIISAQAPSSPGEDMGLNEAFTESLISRGGVSDDFANALRYTAKLKDQKLKRNTQITNMAGYETLTSDSKAQVEATAAAMGVNPSTFGKKISEGMDIYDIGKERGYSRDEVDNMEKAFASTSSNRTDVNQKRALRAASNQLHDFITEGIGKNVGTVLGYSPKNILDQIQNKNKEGQAKYLAALMLASDQAAIQTSITGAPMTQAIVDGLMEKAMMKGRVFQGLVKPDVYENAVNMAHNQVMKMGDAYIKSMSGNRQVQMPGYLSQPEQPEDNILAGVNLEGNEPDRGEKMYELRGTGKNAGKTLTVPESVARKMGVIK